MGITNFNRGKSVQRGGQQLGASGSNVKKVKTGTVTVDPAEIAAVETGETDVTIAGVAAGDLVVMIPPATLDAGIVVSSPSRVSAADTVKLRLGNITAGAINVASATWTYVWFDLT